MKILIADDESVPRMVLRRAVESFGHECLVARDGEEAWRIYRNTPGVEVVISDWMMPGISGLELCRRIRDTEREGYTFFIFVTMMDDKERLLEGLQAGADEYLTKPLDGEQLGAKLIAASRLTEAQQRLDSDAGEATTAPNLREGGAHTRENGAKGASPSTAKARGRRGNVWDVLIAEGKLTNEQVEKALAAQKTGRGELGKTLVSLGFITGADLARAQAQRLSLEFVEITDRDVDRRAAGLIEEGTLRKYGAMPLRIEDGKLIVALSEPTNIYALDDIRLLSGYPVVPVVAAEDEVRRVQSRVFAAGERVSGLLADAAEDPEPEETEAVELGSRSGAEEAPVVQLVDSMLQQAVTEEASDIHVEPQAGEVAVRFRIDGVLRDVMSIPRKLQSGVIARLKILSKLDIAEKRMPQDGRFSARLAEKKIDLRVASLPTEYGETLVLRLLDTARAEVALGDLGLTPRTLERYGEVFRRPYGTVLVTGPTGSGKTTTLYATINELNSRKKKIITVEDPVEYRVRGINQVQVNPKAGLTFASGLRSILRSDPDIVMIGEIRDRETAKISVEAALTGHLVLATLHTSSAPGALTRLTEMGVEPFLISTAVDCVIAQKLARRLCDVCKEPMEISEDVLADMGFPDLSGEEPRFHKAVGCDRCNGTGYRGRVGVYELMVVTDEMRDLILRRASVGEIERVAEDGGMTRLREDGLLKAARGVTTIEEVLRVVV